MIIANPIYDVVFKYLLEDIEIACELLSTILGEEVLSIEVKPQETTTENPTSTISILRFDFKAIIKTNTGDIKKVLIELQKAKQVFDVMRFRRYLGDNYKKEDTVLDDNGVVQQIPLPIVTIYFLGFPLDNIGRSVVKINREYIDVNTNEVLDIKEDFIELLTHDSYMIQLRLLAGKARTKLERVLQVFSPAFATEDKHQLDFTGDLDDPLVKKMVARLGRAIASEEMRDKMDMEDEIDRIFERALGKKDEIIAKKDIEIEAEKKKVEIERKETEIEKKKTEIEKKKTETEKKKVEIEKKKTEVEKKKVENLLKELEELKKQLKK